MRGLQSADGASSAALEVGCARYLLSFVAMRGLTEDATLRRALSAALLGTGSLHLMARVLDTGSERERKIEDVK